MISPKCMDESSHFNAEKGTIWLVIVFILAVVFLGCSKSPNATPPDTDADAEPSDSDTGGDEAGTGDSEAATDADAITDADAATDADTTDGFGCGSDCGNVGDPYEGKDGPPAGATPVSSCGRLNPTTAGQYFLVTTDIGADPSQVCLDVFYPSISIYTIDLGGHTVTGQINIQTNEFSGVVLFNGTVNCEIDAGSCIYVSTGGEPSQQSRLHHLTVTNGGDDADYGTEVQWTIDGSYLIGGTQRALRIDHLTSTLASPQPATQRCGNVYIVGGQGVGGISVEFDHNDVTCIDNAAACQGIALWGARQSLVHHNVFKMAQEPGGESGRAVLFDGTADDGEASDNEIYTRANRAFRVRVSSNIEIHDNLMREIQMGGHYAAVHLGDDSTSTPENDPTNVHHNVFEMDSGNGVSVIDAVGMSIHDNTVTCYADDCSRAGYFARTEAFETSSGTDMSVTNTTLPSGWGDRPAVLVCGPGGDPGYWCSTNTATTSATVCGSGAAVGNGSITLISPPCP